MTATFHERLDENERPKLSWFELLFIFVLVCMFCNYLYWIYVYSEPLNDKASVYNTLFLLLCLIIYEAFIILGIVGVVRGSYMMIVNFALFLAVYFLVSLFFYLLQVNVPLVNSLVGLLICVPYLFVIISACYLSVIYTRPPYLKRDVIVVYA